MLGYRGCLYIGGIGKRLQFVRGTGFELCFDFTTKFQGRCGRTGQLALALFNQIEGYKQQERQQRQLKETKENIAHQLVLLGEQMQVMRCGDDSMDAHQERLLVGHASSKKEQVSGDSWGVQDLQDGRMVQILCDGMGSGQLAMEQSKLAVRLLQTLLSGGLSIRLSLSMINTILSFQYGGCTVRNHGHCIYGICYPKNRAV